MDNIKIASDGMIQAMQDDVMEAYNDEMSELEIRELVRDVASRYGFEQVRWCEGSGWLFCNDNQEFVFGWTETAPDIGFDVQFR